MVILSRTHKKRTAQNALSIKKCDLFVRFLAFLLLLHTNFTVKDMINRALIRLKVVQLIYAYYQNGKKNIESAEKELFFSLSKAYDLYNYLLLFMVDVTTYASHKVETAQARYNRTHEGDAPSTKFIDNLFIAQLQVNKQLLDFRDNQKKNFADSEEILRVLYNAIIESEAYQAYMATETTSYDEDRELWRKLYKTIFYNNTELDAFLEEQSLYWNDDKEIVDTFVLKTIKRFAQENGAEQELLPEFKDEEDKEFASKLFRRTIMNAEYYRHLMSANSRNWELNRLAFMDVIIMQIALAEMLSFPNIPISVTFNEYLDLAKLYSTPKSAGYINGLLDAIAKQLTRENKLMKTK